MTDFTEFIKAMVAIFIPGIIWVIYGVRINEKYFSKRRELEKKYNKTSKEFERALSKEKSILYTKIILSGILAMAVFTLLHRIFNLP